MSERFVVLLPLSDGWAADLPARASAEVLAVENWWRQIRRQAPRARVLVGPVTKWLEPATVVVDGEVVKIDEHTDPETGETYKIPTHGWLVTGWVQR